MSSRSVEESVGILQCANIHLKSRLLSSPLLSKERSPKRASAYMSASFSLLRDVLSRSSKFLLGLHEEATPPLAMATTMMMDTDEPSPFDIVSQNFAKIGLLTLDQFLNAPADIDDCDRPYNYHDGSPSPPPAPKSKEEDASSKPIAADANASNKMACITQLHQACQRAFGKTDALNYEFIEVDGPNSK